jgi:hypothetical protein
VAKHGQLHLESTCTFLQEEEEGVLGRQATSRSQARAKELAELRLQVLVVDNK